MRKLHAIAAVSLAASLSLGGCGPEPSATNGSSNTAAATQSGAVDVATERYHGLFGDDTAPSEMFGAYVVTDARPPPMADHFPELPPDAIMIGAMWADVAPWYMVPESPTRFRQILLSDFAEPVAAVFELGGDGNAVALTIEGLPEDRFGRRARIGDVPTEYR